MAISHRNEWNGNSSGVSQRKYSLSKHILSSALRGLVQSVRWCAIDDDALQQQLTESLGRGRVILRTTGKHPFYIRGGAWVHFMR